jgi:hypothetical protein
MSTEQIYIKTNRINEISATLTQIMSRLGLVGGPAGPISHVPLATRNYIKKRSRHFVLSQYVNGWLSLIEAGDLADWNLADELAKDFCELVIVIALHESYNAWAYILYENCAIKDRSFRPLALFKDIHQLEYQDAWQGDAWTEAHEFVSKLDLPEPFISYQHIVNQKASTLNVQRMFLSYRRVAASEGGQSWQEPLYAGTFI